VSGDHDVVGGKIKAVMPFVIRGIADEGTSGGMQIGWDCRHNQRLEDACW
jgi:hypothetical protein